MEPLALTPLKSSKRLCLVCKIDKAEGEWREIGSGIGKKKQLSQLLRNYGGIHFIEGVICRNCERRLLNLDKSVNNFKQLCQENLNLVCGKRCNNSFEVFVDENSPPKNGERKLKKSTKSSRVRLFENIDTCNSTIIPLTDIHVHVSNVADESITLSSISPLCSSTPVQKSKYTPITPKPLDISSSYDDGYMSSSITCTCISSPCLSDKHTEHSYSKNFNQNKAESTQENKVAEVPVVLQNVLSARNMKTNDLLTNTEIALIQSSLPLCSRNEFIKSILDIPSLKRVTLNHLLAEISTDKTILRTRKLGRKSKLMQKEFGNLKTFKWEDIVEEFAEEFPFLVELLVTVILPIQSNEKKKYRQLLSMLPKLGMIYAILAQARNPELSRVQRCMSMLLFDSLCDQKVFDRLHPVGICMSYGHSLHLLDLFAIDPI